MLGLKVIVNRGKGRGAIGVVLAVEEAITVLIIDSLTPSQLPSMLLY